jgi:predicted lipoprotein with Yx(FWY)xxD motif
MRRVLRPSSGLVPAACALLALGLASCAGGGDVTTLSVPPTTDNSLTLTLQRSPAGPILATGGGDTLYDFAPDSRTHSACLNDGCVLQWPPLIRSGPVRVGRGVNPALVGMLRRPDGSTQLSYGGHPLYSYNLDATPGMVTGQAIDQDGGLWYVLSGRGAQITTAFSVTSPNVNPNS